MPRQTSRFSAFVAALACLIFALGVRDTPERPLLPPPSVVPAPTAAVLSASLTIEVLAVAARQLTSIAPVASNPGTAQAGAAPDDTEGEEKSVPLRGATVRVFWNDRDNYRLVGSGLTDAQGRTKVSSLPRGVLWVIAEAPGRARSSTQLVMDDDERVAALSLVPGKAIDVTVLDEQGAPLEQATVLVTANDPLPHGALTDKNGLCQVNRLGDGPYRIKASARGFESAQLANVTQNTTIRLRRLGALLVRVEDAARLPVGEATVTLSGTSLWPARQVTTNREGVANVRGLLPGSFDVRARKGKFVSATELGVALGRGEERALTLRLVEGRFVTVWVTDGEGDPPVAVPNADVVVAESGLAAFPERGRSEIDGKVTLGPFEPGALSASATARDFVGTQVLAVPDTLASPLRIALRRGGTVRGQVVDIYDHPIAGASIEIIGTDFLGLPVAETPRTRSLQAAGFARALSGPQTLLPIGELGVTRGPIPSIPGAKSDSGDYLLGMEELRTRLGPIQTEGDVENWVTRYDGSFVAHPVTPGRLRALVRHPAYVEGQSELVTLQAGSSSEVKVVLRAGGSLEGIVVDRYGRTLGGVRVELSTNTGSRVQATYTADDGAFAFASLPSEVTLTLSRAENPERAVLRETLTIREGQRETVRLVMPEAKESVECLVTNEQGEPVEGAEIVIASLEAGSPLRQTRFTGADGLVLFEDARTLELSVSVDAPGYAPYSERVAKAPERIRLTLKRGVKVTGRVTSVRGRVAVAMARVTMISQGRRRLTTTDREGIWQMADVPEGDAHLIIEAPNLPTIELDRRIIRQARLDRPFELGDVDLPESGSVSGIVVDGRGEPVIGARVSTTPLGGYAPLAEKSTGATVTDGQGRFLLAVVAIGKTQIFAISPGVGQGRSAPVEIQRERERQDVKIVLKDPIEDETPSAAGSSVAIALVTANGAIVIGQVAPGSEAERSGLYSGDEVVAIDGASPTDIADARRRLSGAENSDVLLEVKRPHGQFKIRTVREPVRL